MQTTCEFCIFSDKDNEVQKGCKLNRLDLFDKEKIDDKYYILDGYCLSCRNVNWDYYCDNPESSYEDLINQCKKENELDYSVFILYRKNDSIKSLINSVVGINNLKYKPKYIYILTNISIEDGKKLYIDIMPHSKINIKIDTSQNIRISNINLIKRGFAISNKTEYTLIISNVFEGKNRLEKLSDLLYKDNMCVAIANFYTNYLVNTTVAKSVLYHYDNVKNLRKKINKLYCKKGGAIDATNL